VIANDLRLVKRDPSWFIIMILMPLALIAFVAPVYRQVSPQYPGSTGVDQAVPGMVVLFSLFLMGNVGLGIYREHGWGTWDRLRSASARPGYILIGKAGTPLILLIVQLTVLFFAGRWLFGMHVQGSYVGIALVGLCLAICLVCLGLAITLICQTLMQLNALTNLGALLLAGLGAAITPAATLPNWAHEVAPYVPTTWAMRGFESQILSSAGLGGIVRPCFVLIVFAIIFAGIAVFRFRPGEAKMIT
jgi:ABC-2 type transport system permease protein